MSHFVDLDASFKSNFNDLLARSGDVRNQIGYIISSLEKDPFFVPGDDYLFQRDPGDQSCVCAHLSGSWGDWKLVWYYEYSSFLPSIIEAVVVTLAKEAIEFKVVRPQSAYQSTLGAAAEDLSAPPAS